MILVLDIGNSDITMGLWDGSQNPGWKHTWRIPSRTHQPELFYGVKMRDYFFEAGLPVTVVTKIVLEQRCSRPRRRRSRKLSARCSRKIRWCSVRRYEKLPIQVLNPYEIGSDLVANAMGAYMKIKNTCIVADFERH